MIYFDNSATTFFKPRSVLQEHSRLMQICGSYGRGAYAPSLNSSNIIFDTRECVSNFFGLDNPENVIFTYNATYALNLAIKSLIYEPCTVLTSSFEHNSTIRPLKHLEKIGVRTKIVNSDLYNHDEFIENFKKSITLDTKFAVINHVSNVFGYILPINEIDEICHKCGIKLILDISQSAGIVPLDISKLKSLVCACAPAHKSLYGVLGLGFAIFTDKATPTRTIIEGGTGSMSTDLVHPDFLPDMLESGTPNAPAIGALRAGIKYVSSKPTISKHVFDLASYFASFMKKFPNTKVFFCDDTNLQTGVVSFCNDFSDVEVVSSLLAKYDICTRAGVHCSPLSHKSAGTDGTIRVSFSSFNDFTEIDNFFKVYRKII